jgi:uncharacterized protein YabN with tetrapyrrole methylase and pyrophosphatase domain
MTAGRSEMPPVKGRPRRDRADVKPGSLMVVGLGINGAPQTTLEAVACMERADLLFYLTVDPVTEYWVRGLNASATSLRDLYGVNKDRKQTYTEMTARIVDAVRAGHHVCAAFYGHPGVLVRPSQMAMGQLRKEGYEVRMFPGISAEACLYADIGLNPGDRGVQSFEATDFLLSRRRFDPTSELILWQIGVLGESYTRDGEVSPRRERLQVLVDRLLRHYPPRHRVVLYQAASFAGHRAVVRRVALERLARADITPMHTLYVPALTQRPVDRRIQRWLSELAG